MKDEGPTLALWVLTLEACFAVVGVSYSVWWMWMNSPVSLIVLGSVLISSFVGLWFYRFLNL